MSALRRAARVTIEKASKLVGSEARRSLGNVRLLQELNRWSKSGGEVAEGGTVEETLVEVPISAMGERPSYRYKLEEMKRRREILKSDHDLRDPIFGINDKYRAYAFADTHGVDHPRVVDVYRTIDDIEWPTLPKAFVLKTRWGSSNIGVKALARQRDDAFLDMLRSRTWTIEEIIEDYERKAANGTVSKSMFAEELILKPDGASIADDWKFYCFNGRVGLSMQRDVKGSGDQSNWRFKFRDRDWNNLGPIKFVDRLDHDLAEPEHPQDLIDTAELLSSTIGRPFIRVDLFDSDRGPLLGEFTPAPGPPEVFTPEIDLLLGEMWERAEAELLAAEIESGVWQHLDA